MVKRTFFKEETPAGAAIDYLEDKAKARVKVLDFLDPVALEAFSRSYKDDAANNYEHIDYLFRCRNKIAHRGALTFRDKDGKSITVDRERVESWWLAVAHLKGWLESLP